MKKVSKSPREFFRKTEKASRKDAAKKTKEAREKARNCWGVAPYAGRHPYYITPATRNSGQTASALLIQGLDRAGHLMNAEGKGPKSALKAVLAYIQLIGKSTSTKDCIKPFKDVLNDMGQAAVDGRGVDKERLKIVLDAMRSEVNRVQQRSAAVQGGLSHGGLL